MADSAPQPVWTPPAKIEQLFEKVFGHRPPSTNSAVAGARVTKDLPVGSTPLQLYSLGTPNGQKVGIMLEELGVDYDAHFISIGGDQFTSGFVAVNPNSKIPAMVDLQGPGGKAVNLFESGSILLYLAEKHQRFLPADPALRAECMNWLFWQMAGFGPMCGNFGHFLVYAPADEVAARDYGAARYGMDVQRMCSLLDQHLADKTYMVGDEYTIADMAIMPWFNQLNIGYRHPSGIGAKEVLSMEKYPNAQAWAARLLAREQVQRGITVCTKGVGKPWLEEQAK